MGEREGGVTSTLQWRHNGRDGVANHQPHDCLLDRLFRRRSNKISKLRVTGLCEENSPGTGEFSAQKASNAANVSIWWHHLYAHSYWLHSQPLWRSSIDISPSSFVYLNSLVPGRCGCNFKLLILKTISMIDVLSTSSEIAITWHRRPLMISQYWFRQWLGAVRYKAITRANADPDLWRHYAAMRLKLFILPPLFSGGKYLVSEMSR